MTDEIKDANLDLLVGLREHLDRAERLRHLLDRLLALAKTSVLPNSRHMAGLDRPRRRKGPVRV